MYKGILNDISLCYQCKKPKRNPVFLFTPPFDLRLAKVPHAQYATKADTMIQIHSWAVEHFDYDWVFIHGDSCMALEPLGIFPRYSLSNSFEPWTPSSHIPPDRDSFDKLSLPDPLKDGRMPLAVETIRSLKEKYTDSLCICGHVTAPFSSLLYLYGAENGLLLLNDDPDLAEKSLAFLCEVQADFAEAQVKAGASIIELGDLNSSSHFISLDQYRRFALPYLNKVKERIHKAGGLCLYHQNEPRTEYIKTSAEVLEKGQDAINIGQYADIDDVFSVMGGSICLTGGIEPMDLLPAQKNTSMDVVREQIEKIVNRLIQSYASSGFILNSAGQIPVETDEDLIKLIIKTVRENNKE